jgi:hypothetical protein
MEVIELTWSMDGDAISAGVDDSPDNPLARATQCLFLEGRPFTRINKCFFLDPDGRMRWLGIFVHSAGDRIIFFPGVAELQQHITAYNGDALRWDQGFKIDHLSLESDRRSWHFSEPRSVAHLGRMYTQQLSPDVFHWFSMSVKSSHDLRLAREETKVSAVTPSRDIDRRLEIFRASREDAEFQIIGLHESSTSQQPSFFHFSVTVGPPGFPSNSSEILGIPYGSPLVKEHPREPLIDIPSRVHRIRLSSEVELEVTSSVLIGDLRNRIIYSGLPNRIQQDAIAQV